MTYERPYSPYVKDADGHILHLGDRFTIEDDPSERTYALYAVGYGKAVFERPGMLDEVDPQFIHRVTNITYDQVTNELIDVFHYLRTDGVICLGKANDVASYFAHLFGIAYWNEKHCIITKYEDYFSCSHCGELTYHGDGFEDFIYCPECGCKIIEVISAKKKHETEFNDECC